MVTISLQQDHEKQVLNDDVNDESHPEEGPTEAIVEWEDSVTEASGGSSVPRTDSTPGFSEQVLDDTQSVPRGTSGKSTCTPNHVRAVPPLLILTVIRGNLLDLDLYLLIQTRVLSQAG